MPSTNSATVAVALRVGVHGQSLYVSVDPGPAEERITHRAGISGREGGELGVARQPQAVIVEMPEVVEGCLVVAMISLTLTAAGSAVSAGDAGSR